jgi:acetyltransferase-like isoleucine patch superfamily enzyme
VKAFGEPDHSEEIYEQNFHDTMSTGVFVRALISVMVALVRLVRFDLTRLLAGGTAAARQLGVRVGEGCRIYSRNFGSEPWLIEIGDRVTITSGVNIITHDGSGWAIRDEAGRRFRYARVRIGSDVFIGVGSILLPGVSTGDRVVMGAGSVVTKSVPSGTVATGNPARLVGSYDDFEARVLRDWASSGQMKGGDFQSRINSVVEHDFRPELRRRGQ